MLHNHQSWRIIEAIMAAYGKAYFWNLAYACRQHKHMGLTAGMLRPQFATGQRTSHHRAVGGEGDIVRLAMRRAHRHRDFTRADIHAVNGLGVHAAHI